MKLARRWLALLGVTAMLTATGLTSATPALAAIVPATSIQIKFTGSGLCLVPADKDAGVQGLVTFPCTINFPPPSGPQDRGVEFKIVYRSSNNYQVVDTVSGKCARLEKTSTDNDVEVILSTCNGDLTGLWKVAAVAGLPTFRLVSAHSGKCMSGGAVIVVQKPCGTTTTSPDQVTFPPTASGQPLGQPATPYQPIVGVQPASSALVPPIVYSYVDSLQQLRIGTQSSPGDGTVQWAAPAGGYSFTGQPQLAAKANGQAQLLARDAATGDVWLQDQTETGFGAIQDVGGALSTQPVIGTDPVDRHLVVFSLVNGGLWHLPEAVNNTYTPYGAWRFVGGSGLIGTPTVVSLLDRIQVFALNAAGHLHTASYQSGQLSDWTNLGGPVLTGTVSVVVYPGFWTRVFARAADGTIVTRKQNSDGTWTADWTTVGDLAGVGSPSAVLDPNTGRTGVVVRGDDPARSDVHVIHFVNETGQLTGRWGSWQPICLDNTGAAIPADTDPVIFPFKKSVTGSDGTAQMLQTWGFATRQGDSAATACWVDSPTGGPAGLARSTQAKPMFAHEDMPLPK